MLVDKLVTACCPFFSYDVHFLFLSLLLPLHLTIELQDQSKHPYYNTVVMCYNSVDVIPELLN